MPPLSELRERTRVYHQRLEASVDVMSPALTRSRYLILLKSFYGFYLPLEAWLTARVEWLDAGLDFRRREKLPRLRQDFAALGLDDAQVEAIPICPASALPAVDTFEEALGCAYVLEGATLGGQHISRHLHGLFAMDEQSGSAFFRSYGIEVGPMWKSFVAVLNENSVEEGRREQIIVSACNTFQALHRWLGPEGG